MSANVWKIIIVRAAWFVVAAALGVLGLIILVQHVTGVEQFAGGTPYEAHVLTKTDTDPRENAGIRCRITIDPASAPEESNAPTRIRSTTPCATIPPIGQNVPLTYVSDGRTVVTTDLAAEPERPSLWLGLALLLAAAGAVLLFVRSSRQFARALDEIGPAPEK